MDYWIIAIHFFLIGDNEVVNLSNNPDQELDLRKANIPDAFDSLIKEVTSSYGLPLSYIQFHKANLLEMLIPPRSKRGQLSPSMWI